MIIKPRNILYVPYPYHRHKETNGSNSLAAVNFFLGCVGIVQVSRIVMWQRSVKGDAASELVQQDAKDAVRTAKDASGVTENPEAAAKNAIQ